MGSLPPTLGAAASTPLFVLLAAQLDRQAGLTAFHPPVLVSSEPLSPKGISISPPEDRLPSPSILTPHPLPHPIACHLRACRPHGTRWHIRQSDRPRWPSQRRLGHDARTFTLFP